MKGFTKLLLSGMAAVLGIFAAGGISVAAAGSTNYKLIWSDEFNGTSLDTTIWNYDIGNSGWGNNEWENYTDSEDNVKVRDGNLVITARAEKDETGKVTQYTSGRLNTSGKASFKFGKMEARIKVPNDTGLWPAFWMLGQNEPKGWPYCGEIDILETWNSINFAQGTIHWENEINKPKRDTYLTGSTTLTDKAQWHVYGLTWTPKEISFSVDDTIYKTIDIRSADKSELREDEYYFLLNCAVGGNLPYVGPNEDFESAQMLVDYVRVYQRESDNGSATFKTNYKNQVPSYFVYFKNLGKTISTKILQSGETIVLPKVKRKKYKFSGWYLGTQKVTDEKRISTNLTIHTKWKKIKLNRPKITSTKQHYKKALSVRYKVKGKFDGFQIKAGKKKRTTESKTITILGYKSKHTYQVKVRAYAIDSTGRKIFGKWSKSVKIKVK